LQDLIHKSKNKIEEYFSLYGINENSLQSDIKKIVLHCAVETLILMLKVGASTVIVDSGPQEYTFITNAVGNKSDKAIMQLKNALKKIFKTKYITYSHNFDLNDLPGEIIEAIQKSRKFNFNALSNILEQYSLSGLKRKVNDNLSVKCALSTTFK